MDASPISRRRLRQLAVAVVTFLGAAISSSASGVTYRTVIQPDQPLPGLPQESAIRSAARIAINNGGDVALAPLVRRPDATDYEYPLLLESQGVLQMVAGSAQPVPKLPSTVKFGGVIDFNWNDRGELAFSTALDGVGVTLENNIALFAGDATHLNLIARRGESAPGSPGAEFSYFSDIALIEDGALGFTSALSGVNDDAAIYAGSIAGDLRQVAMAGMQAPGAPDDLVLSNRSLALSSITNSGAIVFQSGLAGNQVNPYADTVIYVDRMGSLAMIAGTVPTRFEIQSGMQLDRLSRPTTGGVQRIAFSAAIADGDPYNNFLNILLVADAGSGLSEVVAQAGEAVTLTAPSDSAVIRSFGTRSVREILVNDDYVAFVAGLVGQDGDTPVNLGDAIFVQSDAARRFVAGEMTTPPGMPEGNRFAYFSALALNDAGDVAIRAGLEGPDVNRRSRKGLWAEVGGDLRLIAREGDLFEVAPNDFRTIASVGSLYEGTDGSSRLRSWNDKGQLAFSLRFTDDTTGVFVADLSTVIPEPDTGKLLTLLVALAALCGSLRPKFAAGSANERKRRRALPKHRHDVQIR